MCAGLPEIPKNHYICSHNTKTRPKPENPTSSNMKKTAYLITALLALAAHTATADKIQQSDKTRWLEIAEAEKPELRKTTVKPQAIVKPVEDAKAFQHWRYERVAEPDSLYNNNFKSIREITLDFGGHYTGYFTFHTRTLNRCLDAPVRLRLTFGEMPAELNTPFDPWKGGLGRGWMQDETITLMQLDEYVTLPRRMSFRYLKIELLGSSAGFDFSIDDMYFTAQTSAGPSHDKLQPGCPEDVKKINEVGIATLRECMQTVYEDGPKRDQRLWAGDMYLESLANRYSFKNNKITKRCLYLFAGLCQDDGIIIADCFETPKPHPQYGTYCLTYCLLFNSTLLEYYNDTHDRATAEDLWQLAKIQMDDALTYVGKDALFDAKHKPTWIFFDWRDGIDVNTAMQCATIFALEQTYELAKLIGREAEVKQWPALARRMKKAARAAYYDKKLKMAVSGPDRQLSVLSQVWMTKAGALEGSEAQQAIRAALASDKTVKLGTPYATHYLIEAMIKCGMTREARQYLTDYWGGMVKRGADTFWETYDPDNDFLSPYGFSPLNSYCHAWSCTPVYFIQKYPEIFQTAE